MKKRFLAVFLALALGAGLAVPAFAKDLVDATGQDILNTFTIYRNGSVDEKEGTYLVDASFKLPGLDVTPIEKKLRVISKDDAWTITNTGSKELSADDNTDYDLLIQLTIYYPDGGANDTYVLDNGYYWNSDNSFSSYLPETVRLKAGESVTIPASAFMTVGGNAVDPGSIFLLYVEVFYPEMYTQHAWQYYKRYYYEVILPEMRSCSFYFQIDEAQKAQIDSAGSEAPAEPAPEPESPDLPFADVPAGEWYAAAVDWAVENKITNGTNDGANGLPKTFSPNQTCTQEQILTMLYRADRGQGAASGEDVEKAVSWAREKGMIGGDFDGGKACTRSTAMRYIWQAFGSQSAEPSDFSDMPAKSDYTAAVSWAVENGITNGTNNGEDGGPKTFSPDETCTRGHIVTFLHRAYVEAVRLK